MADRIQVRRDTLADWTSNDPTLAAGEIGFVSDTSEFVIGDGTTAFTSLDRATTYGAHVKAVLDTGTPQSINNTTNTVIDLDGTDEVDTDGFHDPSSNPSRVTVPSNLGGSYLVFGWAKFAADGTGTRTANPYVNGSEVAGGVKVSASSSGVTLVSFSTVAVLSAADYVELNVLQNSGSALDVDEAYLALKRIGT